MFVILFILIILIILVVFITLKKEHFYNLYENYLIDNTSLNKNDYLNFLKQYTKENISKDKIGIRQCIEKSSQICTFSIPYSFISNSNTFPAPWLINTYKNVDYPRQTNIPCVNFISNCCN